VLNNILRIWSKKIQFDKMFFEELLSLSKSPRKTQIFDSLAPPGDDLKIILFEIHNNNFK
jgi:hypothetical protein